MATRKAKSQTTQQKAKTEESASTKMSKLYLEQAEKNAPRLKSAVNDLQKMYSGFIKTSFNVQRGLLDLVGMETKFIDEMEDVVNSATEAGLKVQKEWADASIDLSLKTTREIVEKMTK